jgi:excisionase family DNA binding protein
MHTNAADRIPDPNPNPLAGLLTVKRFCELLNVSPRTFQRMRTAGRIPQLIKIGRRPYFRLVDVEAWVASIPSIPTSSKPERHRRVRRRSA